MSSGYPGVIDISFQRYQRGTGEGGWAGLEFGRFGGGLVQGYKHRRWPFPVTFFLNDRCGTLSLLLNIESYI